MNPLLRRILGALCGTITSGLVVLAVESVSHQLLMGGMSMPDVNDPVAVNTYAESLPITVLLSLLVAWCAGAYVGSMVAIRIAAGAERIMTLVIGGVVLAASSMNFFQFPHPLWLMISAIVMIPLCAWLAMPRGGKEA